MMARIITFIVILQLSTFALAVDKIVVNGLFTNMAIVTIDGKQRTLKPGKPSPEGVLLISANSKEAVIEIDGKQETYTLGTHIGSNFKASDDNVIITIAPDQGGMYMVNGSINNYQVKFLVDTGATLISMNKYHAKRLGISYKLKGIPSTSVTASGHARTYLVNLKKVKVGDIELNDVTASVHDSGFPDVILLGNSFLNRVSMSREGPLLQLEKN